MKIKITLLVVMLISIQLFSQEKPANKTNFDATKLTIGGYGQVDFNHPKGENANIDLHRMVLYVGYQFNERVSFQSEVEFEHVKELEVEQAFLNYKISDNLIAKAGLMLVPMGIINQIHEPTTFYSVNRPSMDHDVIPATWGEIGAGIAGKLDNLSIKYQAYIFNGIKSYADGKGFIRGVDGLRKGRQGGAEAIGSKANFSTKIEYYGIKGLKLGAAGYFGNTQTEDPNMTNSVVGVSMLGFDAIYNYKELVFRGQYIVSNLSNTAAYNTLTGKDLGSKMNGFYTELAYNFLPLLNAKTTEKLIAFARYSQYDTQAKVAGNLSRNKAFNRNITTFGLNYKIAAGAVVKMDYQFKDNAQFGNPTQQQLNLGIGFAF